MAKDKKHHEDPVATALTSPEAPVEGGATARATVPAGGPPERLPAPRPSAARRDAVRRDPVRRDAPAATPERSLADSAVGAAGDVAHVVRSVLPNRVPAYLGGTALLVLGVVDLPAALGGALAYEALRRWGPSPARR
jgi:hypothetical protein